MRLIDWCNSNGEFGAKIERQYTGMTDTNEHYSIDNITHGRKVRLLWKCDVCGHEWFARLDTRVYNKTECPRCKCIERNVLGKKHNKVSLYEWCLANGEFGQTVIQRFIGKDQYGNDLDIKNISYATNIKAMFRCEYGHEWKSSVDTMVFNKTGCPVCRDLKFSKSLEDWAAENGEYGKILMNEIDLQDTKANSISYKSGKKFNFTCSACGHTWQTRLSHRTVYKNGCPMCNRASTSFGEQLIYRYYNKIFKNVKNRIKTNNGYEFDIAIFDVNTCIEYNGQLWHSDDSTIKRDKEKREICEKHNINLITVWQSKDQSNSNDIYVNNPKVYKDAYKMIECINKRLGITEVNKDKLKEAMNEAYQYMNFS